MFQPLEKDVQQPTSTFLSFEKYFKAAIVSTLSFSSMLLAGSTSIASKNVISDDGVKNIGSAGCTGITQWVTFSDKANSRSKIKSGFF